MVSLVLFAVAFVNQAPKVEVGKTYGCQIVKVLSASKFWARLDGRKADPILVCLDGVDSPPRNSWAFEAGKRYIDRAYGSARNHEYPIRAKVKIRSRTKAGIVSAEFVYMAHADNGGTTEQSLSEFPLTNDLLRLGYVCLTKRNSSRTVLQAGAQRQALGMWTKMMPQPEPGESINVSVIKVLTPTDFVVKRQWLDTYNTAPSIQVRLKDLLPPAKNSPVYAPSMSYAKRLCGILKPEDQTAKISSQTFEAKLSINSNDRDGAALCGLTYTSYSADTPQGMFSMTDNDYAAEMLSEGFAMINPKAQTVPQSWVDCQKSARTNHKGIWGLEKTNR